MTSYQLPELLSLPISLARDDDDGDLHISPLYNDGLILPLLNLATPNASQNIKVSRQQRTTVEFLRELNPTLLASVFIPFPSFPRSEIQSEVILKRASEWLAMCAVTAEQVLRPGRIVDFESVAGSFTPSFMGGDGSLWDAGKSWIQEQSYSQKSSQAVTEALVSSIMKIPDHPKHSTLGEPATSVEEYVKWRTTINGHAPIFEMYFSSAEERVRFSHCLSLVLEINACVTDIFAYNIHQAWHTRVNGDRSHLNLISYIMAVDTEMTIQGAINQAAEMIRERLRKLRAELDATESQPPPPAPTQSKSITSLASFFSSFINSNKPTSEDSSGDALKSVGSGNGNDVEIRKILLNWVAGMINWAYEVECFSPDVDGDDLSQSIGKKKRGAEVRDYGWVFLIKEDNIARV